MELTVTTITCAVCMYRVHMWDAVNSTHKSCDYLWGATKNYTLMRTSVPTNRPFFATLNLRRYCILIKSAAYMDMFKCTQKCPIMKAKSISPSQTAYNGSDGFGSTLFKM